MLLLLKIFNSRKHLRYCPFLIKLQVKACNFIKKRAIPVISLQILENFQSSFFIEHLWTADSKKSFVSDTKFALTNNFAETISGN